VLLTLVVAVALAEPAAKETVIVGSGTVAPLAEAVVEHVELRFDGDISVDATGSNAGFKLMCDSDNPQFAPLSLSSRKFSDDERRQCEEQLGAAVEETAIGLNGLVAVVKRRGPLADMELTREDLFLAFAADVPGAGKPCQLQPNPHRLWSDIRTDLPAEPIAIFGPGESSGTYSLFVDLAMKGGAKMNECMRAIERQQPGILSKTAKQLRNDVWTVAPEDDIEVVAFLHRHPNVMSVVGYAAAKRFGRHVSRLFIEGAEPSAATFANGQYPLAGELYVYSNTQATLDNPVAASVLEEFVSAQAIGDQGYLLNRGLIPLE